MSLDIVNSAAKYVIALVVVVACFYVISITTGDNTQPWSVITLIVGWLIRDSAANASTANVAKIVAATQPGA